MTTQFRRGISCVGLIISALLAFGCKLGGGGGHHHGSGSGGNNAFCSSGQVSYRGPQAGGDEYLWCISDSAFALTDQNTNSTVNGGFTTGATYPNLLSLTSGSASGTAVEMANEVLLVGPGTLPTGSLAPSSNVIATVFEQAGYCPPSGTNVQFVSLPQSDWTTSREAYGTASLSGSNLTISLFALDGTAGGSETDPYSCDPTTSFITFTDSKGKLRTLSTSPGGLFVAKGGQGAIGVVTASSNISLTAGDTYLGMLYEPNTAAPTTPIGFTVAASGTSLSGFAPSNGNANGFTVNLGSQTSPGLFTGGTFVEGAVTDTNLDVVANSAGGKLVLWGITYNATTGTAVNVLLLQQ
jgi:hypothetical protein